MNLRIILMAAWMLTLCAWGCGNDDDSGGDTDADTDADTDIDADSDADTDSDTDTGTDPGNGTGPFCDPLPPPSGNTITVTPDQAGQLTGIVAAAQAGDTILLADGTYSLGGAYLWIDTPEVTLRSASGDRSAVILDGEYLTTQVISVAASDVTIADLTIRRAYTHPIHVVTTADGHTTGTSIYNVHIVDPREQAIKINPGFAGHYPDFGEIACSLIELTDEGRPHVNPTSGGCYTGGIDAHQARGWIIRDNHIEGFWCQQGLSEHAIHLWRGCRDTLVERNVLRDNARGVGFGLASSGSARTYDDDLCPEAGDAYVCHYGGVIRNNMIFAGRAELFDSSDGFDCGICLWSACKPRAVHNTIVSTGPNFSSIEWRFAGAVIAHIANNAATHPLRERDGASAVVEGNIEQAGLDLFADGPGGELHLAPGSAAIGQGVLLEPGLCDYDIDGDARDDGAVDVGADEYAD